MIGKIVSNKWLLWLTILIVLVGGYFGFKRLTSKSTQPTYQTAQAQKGTLVVSITASGQVTTGDSVPITTQSSGVVKDVLVKNGDNVSKGQVIADITLDQDSQQKQAAAYASYLSAKSSVNSANANLNTLQNTEFTANQKFINDAVARGLLTGDPTYIEENAAWLAAEQNYVNQQNVINQTQASLAQASLALSETSSTITAPASGIASGLTITPGTTIAASQTTTGTSSTSNVPQTVGQVSQSGPIQAEVNLAEIDSVNVAPGQKVTMTLNAFPNKTFTGKVLIVNTNGVVSSGVTNYPAIIAFDTEDAHIYPNMAVNATIITKVRDNVLLVPTAAVQNQNGQSAVRVLRSGNISSVDVTTSDSSDTQTEITSGLSEGDQIVIGTASTGQGSTSSGGSVFGIGGGRGGFGIFRGGGRGG